MLILVSDLHLSDGTTSNNVNAEAFRILHKEIEVAASENEAEEVHLVLLGDIFDLVRTSHWTAKVKPEEHPWNGEFNQDTFTFETSSAEKEYCKVLNDIFNCCPVKCGQVPCKHNACSVLFNVCNKLNEKYKDKFKLTYITGNHDQAVNCYDSMKQMIKARVPFVKFSHLLYEPEYTTLARHGHEWDTDCYAYDFYNKVLSKRGKADRFNDNLHKITTIGEVITAEFMSGLLHYIYEELDADNMEQMEFFERLKDINNIRPMTKSFQWLMWFTKSDFEKYDSIIKNALIEAINSTLKSRLAKEWDKIKFFDKTELFGLIKLISKIGGSGLLNTVSGGFKNIDDYSAYFEGAKEDFNNRKYSDVQYVFYGHTHEALHKFATGKQDGRLKMYINTGTYLPFIEQADDNSFASIYLMTMAFVYKRTEDKTNNKINTYPTLDLWNGVKRKRYETIIKPNK
jgi:UDP-2,3-diacylglucosamine pyrophosphatase LpxH